MLTTTPPSSPHLHQGVYVSLIGADPARVRALGAEVCAALAGAEVSAEDVVQEKTRSWRRRFGAQA